MQNPVQSSPRSTVSSPAGNSFSIRPFDENELDFASFSYAQTGVFADSEYGTLRISWVGYKTWINSRKPFTLFINGKKLGSYKLKDGFIIDTPITSSKMEIVIEFWHVKYRHTFDFAPHTNYICDLSYNIGIGSFGYDVVSENGETASDDLSRIMAFMSGLLPPIGVCGYFLNKDKSPATASASLMAAISGLLGWIAILILY